MMPNKLLYNGGGINMLSNERFPSTEFDDWAETYDRSVAIDQFPFLGYESLLDKVVALADAQPDLSVLDLGTGTGNLALRIAALGCDLWCTDFSTPMLARARQKLPAARFVLHDLRGNWPPELNRPFDRIVSAYVFHHFGVDGKVRILRNLLPHLTPGGRLVIGDIAFPNAAAREKVKIAAEDEWDDEFYWLADETIPALENLGFKVEYTQVSACAGIFCIVESSH
jgi:putative AdoMet-dependent methyltransferase